MCQNGPDDAAAVLLQLQNVIVPGLQDPADRVLLAQAELEGQIPAGLDGGRKILGDGPIEVQSVLAAVQGHGRLELPDRPGQSRHLGPGDIGRVGDHHVKLAEKPAGRGHGVGNQAGDPAAEMEVAGVFLGNFQRRRREIRQRHPGGLQPLGQGQADAARAGTEVQNPGVGGQIRLPLQNQVHHGHGVVPGDQHVRRHGIGLTVKIPLAQNIGQGFPGLYPLGQGQIVVGQLLRQKEILHGQQLGRILAGEIAHQRVGGVGGVGPLLGLQGLGRPPHQSAVGRYHWSAPAFSGITSSRARMATSIMESSGSLVVKFCIHMPGAVRMRVSRLS